MNVQTILSLTDHTILRPECTQQQVLEACGEAQAYHCASACIPPAFVRTAREKYPSLRLTTVIGFPAGYTCAEIKVLEAENAVNNGADELDMVAPIGAIKSGNDFAVRGDISAVRMACPDVVLKVIVEACLLTEEEKIRVCGLVAACGADYLKTSTGFSTGGATVEDVRLFRAHLPGEVKIKAAGGIRTLQEAEALLEAGADRLGSSRIVGLVRAEEEKE